VLARRADELLSRLGVALREMRDGVHGSISVDAKAPAPRARPDSPRRPESLRR
jgi:hypothetical protein